MSRREELEKALEELNHIEEVVDGCLWLTTSNLSSHIFSLRRFLLRELRDKEQEALRKYRATLGVTTP